MTSDVSNFITKTLCDHGGCLDLKRLEEIARTFRVAAPVLRRALSDRCTIAVHPDGAKATDGQTIGPDSLVAARTSLRICQRKPGDCPGCDRLHLCRYLVCGNCTFGQRCKNLHSLDSQHNAKLLKRYDLQDLTGKELFQLLLQNDPYLLPEICPHYNRGNGLHGTCKFTTSCSKLHVCQHYFQGDCKFDLSCKRLHDIDAQRMKIFSGFSPENIKNLKEIYRNKFIIMGEWASAVPVLPEARRLTQQPTHKNPGSPTSSASLSTPMNNACRDEICLFFICRHCSFNEKCVRVHWQLPYKWEVLDSDGLTWKNLPNMEDIEKAYCDPGHDTYTMNDEPSTISGIVNFFQSSVSPSLKVVDFLKMKYAGAPVRRLSSASSVSKPPHFLLTTQWLWYWQDNNQKWLEFGKGDDKKTASVTSETLENVYQVDKDEDIHFSAGGQLYTLHFRGEPGTQQMYQENLKYKTKRQVRRRPCFVSALDVKMKLESASSQSSSSSTAENYPLHWDKNALPDFGYKLVLLSESANDYNMIKMLFMRTMPNRKINSIKRIQNPSLWKVFQWQQEQMKKRNGGKPVNQHYLFHGTDELLIEAICEQNFDWRMCGVHGTAYGKGSYFAKDASYSDRYAKAKRSLNKIMFVALVLVGDYCRGRNGFVRPPEKTVNSRTLFDSCVDSETNPKIFVVFEKQQIYPEYIIDYL